MKNPKAFISYSWSSPIHQEWVMRLATELRESGVDVVLDKWDLKEGHDAHAFMEQMVTDPEVLKVIIVCDKIYAEKANGRSGGVGTETQIITPELYGKRDQDKFVAVISERDDENKPYIPVFYRSRIHIDMSDAVAYADGFEQLLRWVFNKPVHIKPELGAVPNFLTEDGSEPKLLTSAKFRRATEMLRNGQARSTASVSEYFSAISTGLEKFRIRGSDQENTFDEVVLRNIEEFIPFRNECINLFHMIGTYGETYEIVDAMHTFMENLIPYMDRPENVMQFQSWDFDNFRILAHELFLYAVAILLKTRRYDFARRFLETEYYVKTGNRSSEMQSYSAFCTHEITALEHHNNKLTQRRKSVHADILKRRCHDLPVSFEDLQQADIVLFLRANFTQKFWFPITTGLLGFRYGALEIFARATSRRVFSEIAPLFEVPDADNFRAGVKALSANPDRLRWGYHTLDVNSLTNLENLATTA